MADHIRGLTVEIAADATTFNKTMKELRSESRSSQSELNALQKSLELEFDQDKFAQAQEVAMKAIDQTAASADLLRERLAFLGQNDLADTSAYQKLQAELAQTELRGQQLEEQLKRIDQIRYDALAKQVNQIGNTITGVGQALTPISALAGAAVAGIGALGTKAVATADDIATLATQYGMSAEELQRFNYVALQTDTSSESLYKAFVKVRAGGADLASGVETGASKALQTLKLDFDALDGSEEQFYAILNALSSMEDQTQTVAVANELFGDKLANDLLPMIYAGTDAIESYCAEFETLGALSDEQVEALAEFDNVLNRLKTQFSNVAAQIGASVLPLMERLADIVSNTIVPMLQRMADWFGTLSLSQQEFALKALLVVAALAPLALGIGKAVTAVGNLIQAIPKLTSTLSALAAHPIILIIAGIVAILILLYTKCEAFREAINNLVATLGTALKPVLDLIMQVLQSVLDILQPIIDMLGGILAIAVNVVNTALQPVVGVLESLFSVLSPVLEILTALINVALMPLQAQLQLLFAILGPLLQVALIPLQLVLEALQIPLQMLGSLLGWLSTLFGKFADVVKRVFLSILTVINTVLGFIENAINGVIGILNGLIDGINATLGVLGIHIDRMAEVKLKIDTSAFEDIEDLNETLYPGDTVYDRIGGNSTSGDIYNNDYSTNTKTQNVTVTIQNYAAEVDVDDMVRQINLKLAEAM